MCEPILFWLLAFQLIILAGLGWTVSDYIRLRQNIFNMYSCVKMNCDNLIDELIADTVPETNDSRPAVPETDESRAADQAKQNH